MIAKAQQKTQLQQDIAELKEASAKWQRLKIAIGNWDDVQKQPTDKLPGLLDRQIQLLAARRKTAGVSQAANALRKIDSMTPANLYHAACGYGLCAMLATGWPGRGPFHPLQAQHDPKSGNSNDAEKYRLLAMDLLQAAVKTGYKDTAWLIQDPDLAALRELPEFKRLLGKLN